MLFRSARETEVREDLGAVPLPMDGPVAGVHLTHMQQRSRWFIAGVIAMFLFLLIIGRWTASQWYVADIDGYVGLYHGVPQSIGPFTLSRLEELTDLRLTDLPSFERQQVDAGISASSRAAALEIIDRIQQRVADCASTGCP